MSAHPDELSSQASPAAAASAFDVLRMLSETIGPRPAGSQGERRAATRLLQHYERARIAAVRLPTRVRAAGAWELLLYAPAGLLALLIGVWRPWLGVAAGLLALTACLLELNGRILLTRGTPWRDADNVLAIVPARRREIRRLVVLANLDTPEPTSVNRALRWLLNDAQRLIVVELAFVPPTLAAYALFSGRGFSGALPIALAAVISVSLLAVGVAQWTSPGSRGAVTNASGLAALVGCAGHLGQQPAQWVETWFLATAAGEARHDGLRAFLTANRFDPETTYFVQLQSVGGGELRYAVTEGFPLPRAANPALVRLVTAAGAARPAIAALPVRRLTRGTQAGAAQRAGYAAITLVGCDRRGAIPRRASPDDTLTAVDRSQVEGAVSLVVQVVALLDADAEQRNRAARLARHSTRPDAVDG